MDPNISKGVMAQFIRLCLLWTILTTIAILLLAVVVVVGIGRFIWYKLFSHAEARCEHMRDKVID